MADTYDAAKQQAWQQTGNYSPDAYAVTSPAFYAPNPMLAQGSGCPTQAVIAELMRYQSNNRGVPFPNSIGPKNRLAGQIGEGPTMAAVRRGFYHYA